MREDSVTVLIADDSDLLRVNVKKLLTNQSSNWTIIEAHSLFNTLKQLEITIPDAMILDLQLGDGTGFQVLEFVDARDLKIPTIVLTNYPTEHYKARCRNLGVRYFLDKSFEFELVPEILYEIELEMRKSQL
jgi:DNA-binding NarL/FixJ family response regulator